MMRRPPAPWLCVTTVLLASVAVPVLADEPARTNVAVLDLRPEGDIEESETAMLTEELRRALHKSGAYRVIERSQMAEVLKEQGFQQAGCTSDACAVEMGQLLGVRSMVAGTIGPVGSYMVVNVRVIDVATGEIQVNESLKVKGGVDKVLEEGIDAVTAKLVEAQSAAADGGDDSRTAEEDAEDDNSKRRRAIVIGSVSGAAVAGAAAVVIILVAGGDGGGDDGDVPPPNTTVTF